jgi:hypothetical protein
MQRTRPRRFCWQSNITGAGPLIWGARHRMAKVITIALALLTVAALALEIGLLHSNRSAVRYPFLIKTSATYQRYVCITSLGAAVTILIRVGRQRHGASEFWRSAL